MLHRARHGSSDSAIVDSWHGQHCDRLQISAQQQPLAVRVRRGARLAAGGEPFAHRSVVLYQTRDLGIFRYDFAGTAMDGEAVVVRVWLKAVARRQEVPRETIP